MMRYSPDFLPENYRLMFSSLDCSDMNFHAWTFNWLDNRNLPPCGLNFNYPDFDKINWEVINPNYFKLVNINVRDVLDNYSDDCPGDNNGGYTLSPFKYYRVREILAQNEKIEYPEVITNGHGEYVVFDGRHRLNALLKIYGIESIKAKVFLMD